MNMGSICAEKQHKFHHSHQLYHHLTTKVLREIDIPPRKLLNRRPAGNLPDSPDGAAVFSKFLPCNTAAGDSSSDEDDPYSSDHFRMFEFKVRKCSRSRSHDWTDCPFAHPGEKARRRDPRRFCYSGTVCPDFKKGGCPKGDACEFSHGVFECWLHPSRYRTEACKDGKNCKRKVCFFAHSSRQLRIVTEIPSPTGSPGPETGDVNSCCPFCHSSAAPLTSPTSTLMAHLSPPPSPPFSPEFSRFHGLDGMSYKEALAELLAKFEVMNVAADPPPSGSVPWLDGNISVEEVQPPFVLSPSVPLPVRRRPVKLSGGGFSGKNLMEEVRYNNNEGSSGGPDLDWVNDLLT